MKQGKETVEDSGSEEMFYCERASCELRVGICLRRQKENAEKPNSPPFPTCVNCDQGEENRLLKEVDQDMARGGDPAGGAASGKESGELKGELRGEREVRLCKCGKSTLSPSCPFCASCMAKKGNEAIQRKRASTGSPPRVVRHRSKKKSKRGTEPTAEKEACSSSSKMPEKAEDLDSVIAINFGEHSSILEAVKGMAKEELRPVELQIIYLLRRGLEVGVKKGV
jgi:CDGSH-type Zn-finger protein